MEQVDTFLIGLVVSALVACFFPGLRLNHISHVGKKLGIKIPHVLTRTVNAISTIDFVFVCFFVVTVFGAIYIVGFCAEALMSHIYTPPAYTYTPMNQ